MKNLSIINSTLRTRFRLADKTVQIIEKDTGMSVRKIEQTPLHDLQICYTNNHLTHNSWKSDILPKNIYLQQGRILDLQSVKDYLSNINMSFIDCMLYKFKNIKKHIKNCRSGIV